MAEKNGVTKTARYYSSHLFSGAALELGPSEGVRQPQAPALGPFLHRHLEDLAICLQMRHWWSSLIRMPASVRRSECAWSSIDRANAH